MSEIFYSLLQPGFGALRWLVPALVLCALACGLVAARPGNGFARGLMAAFLLAAALLGMVNYNKEQWRVGYYLNSYEFFHYYLGAKYADELGYTGLYSAALLALEESGRRDLPPSIRNLEKENTMSARDGLAQGQEYKKKFDATRWESFKKDVSFFRGRFNTAPAWNKMMLDKGYNATPVWTMIGGALANAIPTSNLRGMYGLALLDAFLVLLAMVVVAFCYRWEAALLIPAILGAHYVATSPTLHAAFLRYDWLVALLLAACVLKRGWFATAGALTAYAACVRVFPVFFLFGPLAYVTWAFLRTRSVDRSMLRFGIAFVVFTVMLVAASLILTSGFSYWREFMGKISGHNDDIAPWRVGLKYVYLVNYAPGRNAWGISNSAILELYGWWLRGIQLASLATCFLAARNLKADAAYLLGFIPVFLLSAGTYYYYVLLLVPLLFFAAKIERPHAAIGVALIFASGIVAHLLADTYDRSFPLFFWVSAMAALIAAYMILCALFTRRDTTAA